ncbi:MAG: hypothetical protein AAB652_00610 [Patescibacteria group bacterium]
MIGSVLILLGIIFFIYQNNKGVTFPRGASTEEKVSVIREKGTMEDCALVRGVMVNGTDYETVCRNNVAYQLALKTLDPKYCKGLDNKLVSVEQCESEILLKKINTGADIAVCGGASVQGAEIYCRDVYRLREAIQKGDEALCDTIEDIGSRAPCRERVAIEGLVKNPSGADCSRFSGSLTRDCRNFKNALNGGDRNACTIITNDRLRSECINSFSKN